MVPTLDHGIFCFSLGVDSCSAIGFQFIFIKPKRLILYLVGGFKGITGLDILR